MISQEYRYVCRKREMHHKTDCIGSAMIAYLEVSIICLELNAVSDSASYLLHIQIAFDVDVKQQLSGSVLMLNML